MNRSAWAAVLLAACLLTPARTLAAADEATLFRLFLKDGTTLVSYGEFAIVGDRVVFSMPTGSVTPDPSLHLVNIAADRVDWTRTNNYADSARTAHYVSTQAESDYAALANEVANTLNQVTAASNPETRLQLAEAARKALAVWPATHFNYRATDVRQLLARLDEAIAGLRAAAGASRFEINLAAYYAAEAPPREPVLPPPTVRDAIEQTLLAARLADSAPERESLLQAALAGLDRDASALPSVWVVATRGEAKAALDRELLVDSTYQGLTRRALAYAGQRARLADVRGIERLLVTIQRRDVEYGGKRPDDVTALMAAVQVHLDAARQARLVLDRWELRAPAYREYRAAISVPVDLLAQFARVKPALEDIKSLAGSTPGTLVTVRYVVAQILKRAPAIVPPEELQSAHALLVSAAQMADAAVQIRREATLSGDIARAWDASSAAAGAIMLAAQARNEIQALLRPPQFR